MLLVVERRCGAALPVPFIAKGREKGKCVLESAGGQLKMGKKVAGRWWGQLLSMLMDWLGTILLHFPEFYLQEMQRKPN